MKNQLLAFLVVLICSACATNKIDRTLQFSSEQIMSLFQSVKGLEGRLPRSVDKDGNLVTSDDYYWCSGFTAGTLWRLYEFSKNDSLRNAAETLTKRVERQQFTTNDHDVGFIIYCSYGNGYRLTENEAYKAVIVNAARSLSTRFSMEYGVIRSWDNPKWKYPVIIDNIMNLELLCAATRYSGDSSFYKIAVSHADTTMKYHFRPDGSSFHLVDFGETGSGKYAQMTHQGYADESSWARGQAWGLYGFTMMYRETKKPEYLAQAVKIADFIINNPNLPEDKIPYWDFDAPDIPNALRDASAGAIICSALIELSTFADKKHSEKYLKIAKKQIDTLSSSKYLAGVNTNGNFILRHGVGHFPNQSEIDVPLTYADYYFVEALMRYRKLTGNKIL